ncbi:hypothetical protein [Fulvivirga ligni]|uniref:hypothetical protein n=1 Tax=Fulvivirga ligni TaxID=2904246 RepID=UPI001F24BCB3|nr:hypothetical protein [Fulvivirga ligni]UII20921.1 hypothetical protein LVD16_24055 [Fulvivirga ligni]
MKKLFGAITLILTVCNLFGQTVERCDSTKAFWIIEKDKSTYTIKILGDVKTTERKNVISVDMYALQYLIVDTANYVIEGKSLTELQILANYVSSEVNYMSRQFQTKLEAQMQKAPLSSDKDVLIWWYKMPDGMNEEVSNQLFACIIMDDKIFGLASPQFIDQKFEDIRDFLMDNISTLKRVENKKELKKLCE